MDYKRTQNKQKQHVRADKEIQTILLAISSKLSKCQKQAYSLKSDYSHQGGISDCQRRRQPFEARMVKAGEGFGEGRGPTVYQPGERCKSPSRAWGGAPAAQSFFSVSIDLTDAFQEKQTALALQLYRQKLLLSQRRGHRPQWSLK